MGAIDDDIEKWIDDAKAYLESNDNNKDAAYVIQQELSGKTQGGNLEETFERSGMKHKDGMSESSFNKLKALNEDVNKILDPKPKPSFR